MKEYSLKFSDIKISSEDFLPFIKNEDGNVNELFSETVHEVLSNVQYICNLRGGFIISDVITVPENYCISVSSQHFNTGKIVYNQLKKSEKAAIFVCTAGKEISEWSNEENKKGDLLKSYFIDLAGSIIVESVVDYIHNKIEIEALVNNLKATNRYSPGYCDWNVSEQGKLFSLFPENFCGVSLSSSSLMKPIKSVSGIIGLGKDVKKNDYTCKHCNQENCIFGNKK